MKLPLLWLAMISVTGCAMQQGDFPSLAKRPYEDGSAIFEPAPNPPSSISALPASVQAAVDAAVVQSSTAHARFLRLLPSVKNRVNAARGSAVSSESWVVAQMDLAALEISRTPSVSALADIDDLYLAQLNAEFAAEISGGAETIEVKRAAVSAQVNNQQDEINLMKARLR